MRLHKVFNGFDELRDSLLLNQKEKISFKIYSNHFKKITNADPTILFYVSHSIDVKSDKINYATWKRNKL
jgi:hypothetical protein